MFTGVDFPNEWLYVVTDTCLQMCTDMSLYMYMYFSISIRL